MPGDLVLPGRPEPELVYVEPDGRYVAILSAENLEYSRLDWRQRAFIRAAASRVLARLDATEAPDAG